jgi:hypothetical protein
MLVKVSVVHASATAIQVREDGSQLRIDTDALSATIAKKEYVSGIAGGSFVDKKTGAHDLAFGLHVMDFLLAPGWRDNVPEMERVYDRYKGADRIEVDRRRFTLKEGIK